jgi:hypothetical protein
MTGLVLETVKCFVAERALVWSWEMLVRVFLQGVLGERSHCQYRIDISVCISNRRRTHLIDQTVEQEEFMFANNVIGNVS